MYEQTYWIVTGISVIFFLERGVTTFSNSSMTINATADMKGANLSIPTRIRYTSLLLLGIVTTVGLVEVGHQLGWGGSEFLLGFKPEMIWVGLLGCITSMISAKIDTKIKQKFYEEFKLKDSDNEFRRQRISELRNRLREQSKSMRKMEPETKRTKKALEDAKRKSRSNKKTIDRWNSENKQMMKKVDEAKAERKRMDKEINAATKENAEIESELTDIENKNQIILKEIKSLQTKRRSKSSQLADKEKQYNQLVTTFVADEKMNSKQKKEINRINKKFINLTKDAAKLKKDIETNEVLIPLKESLEQELEEEVDKLESHNNELDKILEYYRKLGVDIEVLKKDIEIKAETVKAVREIKHKEEDCEDETHIFE